MSKLIIYLAVVFLYRWTGARSSFNRHYAVLEKHLKTKPDHFTAYPCSILLSVIDTTALFLSVVYSIKVF
jgi:hypothetical protein